MMYFFVFLVGLVVGVFCNFDGVCISNEFYCVYGYVKGCYLGLCMCEYVICKKFV